MHTSLQDDLEVHEQIGLMVERETCGDVFFFEFTPVFKAINWKRLCETCGEREVEEGEDECDPCFQAYADWRWREGAADAYGDDEE